MQRGRPQPLNAGLPRQAQVRPGHPGGSSRDHAGRQPAPIAAGLAQHLGRSTLHHPRADPVGALDVAAQQRAVGYQVDDARRAPRDRVQPAQRRARKQMRIAARAGQPVDDVGVGVLTAQRAQVVACRDPLRQLAQFLAVEQLGELRLAQQNDAQQLALIGFQIGQQTNLLEHRW
ncbi:MAG: hypothetical protein R3E86_09910 [Pseudomonadales bacterium]